MALDNLTNIFTSSYSKTSRLSCPLDEEFTFSENKNLFFHWADYSETCNLMKAQIENNSFYSDDLKLRQDSLSRLTLIPMWVRTQTKVHQTTMYSLYEKYSYNHSEVLNGIDPFSMIEISCISASGPYKKMSIVECFNLLTYRDFIFISLFKNKIPKRDYRVRLRAKILAQFGANFEHSDLVSIEQLTLSGILLSIDSEVYKSKVSQCEGFRLLLNTKLLSGALDKNLSDLRSYISQYPFNLLYSSSTEDALLCKTGDFVYRPSFEVSKNNRTQFFISYENLIRNNGESVKAIQDFVSYTKTMVDAHYQIDLKRSAA